MKARLLIFIMMIFTTAIYGQVNTRGSKSKLSGSESNVQQRKGIGNSAPNTIQKDKISDSVNRPETLNKPKATKEKKDGKKGKRPPQDVLSTLKGIKAKDLPKDLRKLIEDFEKSKRDYAKDHKRLRGEFSKATYAARKTILKEARDKAVNFISAQKDRRREIEQRLRELRRENNRLKDIFDAAKEAAEDNKNDVRRGDD